VHNKLDNPEFLYSVSPLGTVRREKNKVSLQHQPLRYCQKAKEQSKINTETKELTDII
jgi:hypothetical protein